LEEKAQRVSPLEIPGDYARPAVQSTKGAIAGFKIDKQVSAQLQQLSQEHGTTLFMTVLACFKVLLYKYSGQHDICVGTPIANRTEHELEGLIGFFVNTLALRTRVAADISFTDLLSQVKKTTLEAYANQDVPFEKVVDAVVADRDMSRTPLFQVMFALQNTPDVPRLHLGKLQLSSEAFENTTAKFDLSVTLTVTSQGLQGSVQYCTELFTPGRIARLVTHFKELLGAIVQAPGQNVGALQMLTQAEQHQLLVEFNDNRADYPKSGSIVQLFEQQARDTPKATALVFEDKSLSYDEVNERANRLAHCLRSRGVKEETMVPICIDRSPEMIIAILAILKAGGAYVPIDPDYPAERIQYILDDTNAKIVLSSQAASTKLRASASVEILELDNDWDVISREPLDNLEKPNERNQLAYVIYTSGSTGKPKGSW
jgi:non-ribosomal peptide synthetase component F